MEKYEEMLLYYENFINYPTLRNLRLFYKHSFSGGIFIWKICRFIKNFSTKKYKKLYKKYKKDLTKYNINDIIEL